jgi:hypothetical protein
MTVTLRRAGQFDPAEFFPLDLIQIKWISRFIAESDPY